MDELASNAKKYSDKSSVLNKNNFSTALLLFCNELWICDCFLLL